MGLTESNMLLHTHTGLDVDNLAKRLRRRTKAGDIEVGEKYVCQPTNPWKHEYIGECVLIYNNSAIVKIIATHVEDDHLIAKFNNQAVVSFKNMKRYEDVRE